MGWFDGASEVGSSSHHHKSHSHSGKHRHSSPSRSIFGVEEKEQHRHSSPSRSIFGGEKHHHHSNGSGIFGLGDPKHNASRSSFLNWAAGGAPSGGRSSSYYKRSPRHGYMARMYSKLRRLLRDLLYYLKKHPIKVFMLVIMPLITGGALTGLLAKFGIRLPYGIEKMFGAGGGRGGGLGGLGGLGRDNHGHMQFERSRVEGPLGGLGGGIGSMIGGLGGLGSAVSVAKMFL